MFRHSRLSALALLALPLSLTSAFAQTAALPETVISANQVPQPADRVGASVTVLKGDELRAQGVETVADALRMVEASGRDDYNLELTRLMVEEAPGALARLIQLGVQFSGPHPEPPHTVYRMHNVVPDASGYIDTLSRAVERRFEAMGLPAFPGAALLLFWGGRAAGFDPDAHHEGFGLLGMRERAQRIGARLTVTSERARGTRVETLLPLQT